MNATDWRRRFEMSADNPVAWLMSAENLLRSARAVASVVCPGPAGTTDVIVGVQAMLIGMSIECTLKALWLKQHRRFVTRGLGFIRVKKRKRHSSLLRRIVGLFTAFHSHENPAQWELDLDAMPGAKHHNLRRMAETVGKSDVAELELLERLSWFVKWAGRYPVPGSAGQMFPKTFKVKGQVIPYVINVQDATNAEALAVRLLEEAPPWK